MMIMSDFEIYRAMRTAKSGRSKLDVLAQLNGTSPERILDIYNRYDKEIHKKDREYRELAKIHRKNSERVCVGSSRIVKGGKS